MWLVNISETYASNDSGERVCSLTQCRATSLFSQSIAEPGSLRSQHTKGILKHTMESGKALRTVQKLKAKLMDTSAVLELHRSAQERQCVLEQEIVQERAAATAARATASEQGPQQAKIEELVTSARKHEEAATASARRATQLEEALASQTKATAAARGEIEDMRRAQKPAASDDASERRAILAERRQRQLEQQVEQLQQQQKQQQQQQPPVRGGGGGYFPESCTRCKETERACEAQKVVMQESQERALADERARWDAERKVLTDRVRHAEAAEKTATAAAAAAAGGAGGNAPAKTSAADSTVPVTVVKSVDIGGGGASRRSREDYESGGSRAGDTTSGGVKRARLASAAGGSSTARAGRVGERPRVGDGEEEEEEIPTVIGEVEEEEDLAGRALCEWDDEAGAASADGASGRAMGADGSALLPPKVSHTLVSATVTDALSLLDGELVRWVYPSCSLRQPTTHGVTGMVHAVSMELAGCAAVAVGDFIRRVVVRGDDFRVEFVQRLGERIAPGEDGGRGGSRSGGSGGSGSGGVMMMLGGRPPLTPHELQRGVLRCHVFARACRLSDDANRLRQAAFRLARYHDHLEPCWLAALVCGWAQPLSAMARWDVPALDSSTPYSEQIAHAHSRPLPAAMAAPLTAVAAPLVAALDLRLRRLMVSGDPSPADRAVYARAVTLLAHHGGVGWTAKSSLPPPPTMPLPAASPARHGAIDVQTGSVVGAALPVAVAMATPLEGMSLSAAMERGVPIAQPWSGGAPISGMPAPTAVPIAPVHIAAASPIAPVPATPLPVAPTAAAVVMAAVREVRGEGKRSLASPAAPTTAMALAAAATARASAIAGDAVNAAADGTTQPSPLALIEWREATLIAHLVRGALPSADAGVAAAAAAAAKKAKEVAEAAEAEAAEAAEAAAGRGRGRGRTPGRGRGGSRGRGRGRGKVVGSADAARAATAAAIASAIGSSTPSSAGLVRPGRSASDCILALELIAHANGWAWTDRVLIRGRLVPLLDEGGGRSAILKLLGRLGTLAPSHEDASVVWLRSSLKECIGAARFGLAGNVAAVSSFLQLLPPPGYARLRGVDAAGVRAVDAWVRSSSVGWDTVSLDLRDKFHEVLRELEAHGGGVDDDADDADEDAAAASHARAGSVWNDWIMDDT